MDVMRDNLGMESTTSVSVSLVDASSDKPIALYIALKATFVVMVLIHLTFFIEHWYRGKVFSFVTLTDKLDYYNIRCVCQKVFGVPQTLTSSLGHERHSVLP